jgi:hypothetical protein
MGLTRRNPRGVKQEMPWSVERVGSGLHVHVAMPMIGEWEAVMDEVQANLDPRPLAIHIPSKMAGATNTDTDMLKMLWDALGSHGIPLLPPTSSDDS